eukprot:8983919-Pyramimonas_sp.AAC.1
MPPLQYDADTPALWRWVRHMRRLTSRSVGRRTPRSENKTTISAQCGTLNDGLNEQIPPPH